MKTEITIRKKIRRLLTVFLIALSSFALLTAEELYPCARAFAGEQDQTILEQGDLLTVKDGSWQHEYIVLNPDLTNTKKPGIFLLQKDYPEKTAFNDENADLESANSWEDSLAQAWCADYYSSMPETVRSAVIGVKTFETESGFKWAGVNNIDGTRTGADGNKDKVFFLSYIEYDSYRDSAGIDTGEKWFLRSPYACGDLKVYVCAVTEDGSIHDFGTSWPAILGARPAFNISPSLERSCSVCRHGKDVTWNVGADSGSAVYENISYSWSSDNRKCTAKAFCRNCGKDISETVSASVKTRKATTTAAGSTVYTVAFTDSGFATQTRTIRIPKKPGTILNKKLPAPIIKGPKRSGKTVSVRWKAIPRARRSKISGIEIMAATDKQFKKGRIVRTAKKTKTTYKLKGLKKKTYWIKVRTYKKKSGIKYVSKWSKARKVRIR